jgi:hypothetical protein
MTKLSIEIKKHALTTAGLAHHRLRLGHIAFITSILGAITVSAAPSGRRVVIGNDGKLEGAANGYAWVAGSDSATVHSPSPCNFNGCFKNTGGQLCTKGNIKALSCTGQGTPQLKCDWDKNWGFVLGFNTNQPAGPWGDNAPRSVTVNYTSVAQAGSAGHFRLTAHIAGDPNSKQYCIDYYTPGAVVQATDMKSQCWFGAGDTLKNFRQVDTIGLLRVSENIPVSFDFCVTAITTD